MRAWMSTHTFILIAAPLPPVNFPTFCRVS